MEFNDKSGATERGRTCELESRILLEVYNAAVTAVSQIVPRVLVDKNPADAKREFVSTMTKVLGEAGLAAGDLISEGDISFEFKQFNTFGEEREQSAELEHSLFVLRVQINNLRCTKGGAPIGSVLYADSFFAGAADLGKGNDKEDAVYAPERRFCLTNSIPRLQAWFTSHEHYEHMHAPLLTEKVIRCEQLGDKTFYVPDVVGVLPLTGRNPEHLSFERDYVLKGKLVFLEKGIIFDDSRLGPTAITFD